MDLPSILPNDLDLDLPSIFPATEDLDLPSRTCTHPCDQRKLPGEGMLQCAVLGRVLPKVVHAACQARHVEQRVTPVPAVEQC